jgi:hypothetical protein
MAPPFLTAALDGGELSASRPCRFTPGQTAPGTHWMGGWVSSRVGLGAVEKIEILHCRESNPDRPARSPSTYRLSYPVHKCAVEIAWKSSSMNIRIMNSLSFVRLLRYVFLPCMICLFRKQSGGAYAYFSLDKQLWNKSVGGSHSWTNTLPWSHEV